VGTTAQCERKSSSTISMSQDVGAWSHAQKVY